MQANRAAQAGEEETAKKGGSGRKKARKRALELGEGGATSSSFGGGGFGSYYLDAVLARFLDQVRHGPVGGSRLHGGYPYIRPAVAEIHSTRWGGPSRRGGYLRMRRAMTWP